ncbi:MAG: VOC family protein [Actinophytocola sp.]|uniref:VOC family protein n=1 Tax=Actinophytocola sp. TaxID=1872138 RepID=UPI0013268C3A|nr:VOC family protein [Actinophytocola sp.]MPZ86375.1 VOC family protein [Actinophytocola sp.]
MIGSLQCVVLDCADDVVLARFYQSLLGGEVNRPDRRWSLESGWSTLHVGSFVLCFQRVADHRPPRWPDPAYPQQSHVDIGVADLPAAHDAAVAAGATVLDVGDGNRGWRIYADPAGHPFCLVREAR